MLVRVLDGIRQEAAGTKHAGRYAVGSSEVEKIWQARARAYIHLYLKVMFGIRSFSQREHYVTDEGRDGGIDGYYIDANSRVVYILQSKFRHSEANFEGKPIELSELLAMQIRRVLSGEEHDVQGHEYNGKIKGMQRALTEVYDIGRYTYKVVILANIVGVSDSDVSKLTDNTPFEIVDYERSYVELLYPVVSGTLFKAAGLGITLDLSNKSTGAKIGYTVIAEGIECEISVVYVPTLEIGRILSEYKNSILSYNPRSYLEFEGEKVNGAIRNSIIEKSGNEFALLNNGLTIICDESGVNDRSGRRGKAQLFLLNPQIINGGQTAYTLSRIYESLEEDKRDAAFEGKEVLVKTIAVPVDEADKTHMERRLTLIENISEATNSQTVVTNADRTSGDPVHVELQDYLFRQYGILYERKRGEFAEGIRAGYLDESDVVQRTKFARIYLAANQSVSRAQKKRVTVQDLGPDLVSNRDKLARAVLGLKAFDTITRNRRVASRRSYVNVLPQMRAAIAASSNFGSDLSARGAAGAEIVTQTWTDFLTYLAKEAPSRVSRILDYDGQNERLSLVTAKGTEDRQLETAIDRYYSDRQNLPD